MKINIYLREKNVEKTVNGVGDEPLQSMDKRCFRGEKRVRSPHGYMFLR